MKILKQKSLFLSSLILIGLLTSACTESRNAKLPEAEAQDILDKNIFGETEGLNSRNSMKLDSAPTELSPAQMAKAEYENGAAAVESVQVPEAIRFMFKHLQVSGQAGKSYPVTFSIDRKFVTAYKVVSSLDELNQLEKEYAVLRLEVVMDSKLQKATSAAEKKTLALEMQKLQKQRQALKASKDKNEILVPIFQYAITSYGVLERTKNDLNEETSTLRLKETDWDQATHIKIAARGDNIGKIDVAPDQKEILDRTFSLNRLHKKIATAEDLKSIYQLQLDMPPKTLVYTVLDTDGINALEITTKDKLTESQRELIKTGAAQETIMPCSEEVLKMLPKDREDLQKDCVTVYRYVVPVKYVALERPLVDNFGNKSGVVRIKDGLAFSENVGLVNIPEKIEPKKVEVDGLYNSDSMIRVADIKDKEFFFRRTLEDAPVTSTFMPGEASGLTIVKFELNDTTLTVKKADQLVGFKTGKNDTDNEDVMTIPVFYFRKESVDARGAPLAYPMYVKTNRERAEYVLLNWADNRLDAGDSPISAYSRGQCFAGIADKSVRDVDMRMKEGVLSFTYQYTVNFADSLACIGLYIPAQDYNPAGSYYQLAARIKERVSFKANDGSLDKSFAPQTPFPVQNALGYGVWTVGKLKPSNNGVTGREGQQENLVVVHDFRNGKVLKYTVTGLPTDDAMKRALYRKTTQEVVAAWNFAYHQAFKGTYLERRGDYVEVEFAGDPGVNAHLGDIDKNIIHFENKFNDNHGVLGVSQVGFNPRSGIVIADSLIIYAGNLSQYVEATKRNARTVLAYRDLLKKMKEGALEELKKKNSQNENTTEEIGQTGVKKQTPQQAISGLNKNLQAQSAMKPIASKKQISQIAQKSIANMSPDLRRAFDEMKKLESGKKQTFSPNVESAYIQAALEKALQNPNLDQTEVEGLVAAEMLKANSRSLTDKDRFLLGRQAQLAQVRSMMKSQYKNKPGCLITPREGLETTFATESFEESLRTEIYFTLGHEMGHSQGLTHNFIGSFDKKNFIFPEEKDLPADQQRNYSSIMDYIAPGLFSWKGLGPYDSFALRASHTGLLEMHPLFAERVNGLIQAQKDAVNKLTAEYESVKSSGDATAIAKKLAELKAAQARAAAYANLVVGPYVHIDTIQKQFASQGWSNFKKSDALYVVKDFKYCTDKDVGYEPTCQRFDFGSSAAEIVKNKIRDYENTYITSYYSWDRNEFGYSQKAGAVGRNMSTMIDIRQFMDELFYKLILERPISTGNQKADELAGAEFNEQVQDYFAAAIDGYLFYNQVIRTPDANSRFLSQGRFVAVPYEYSEKIKDPNTGEEKEVVKQDVQIVEKKAISDIAATSERLDTIGIEMDKIMAMNLLTLKGLPYYKYYSQSLELSFLDFEKYILGVKEPLNSISVSTFTGMLMDRLQPTFSNEHVNFHPIEEATSQVTSAMRAYAGVFTILGLESSTLKDKDNFANLFKVGSSLGRGPSDRKSLAPLGVASNSRVKLLYWSLDNAEASNLIVEKGARKAFFIANESRIVSVLEKTAELQIQLALDDGKDAEKTLRLKGDLEKATKETVAQLTDLNKKGEIVTKEEAEANPALTIEGQVGLLARVNLAVLQSAAMQQPLGDQLASLADTLPLVDYTQKAMKTAAANLKIQGLDEMVGNVIDGTVTETRYGLLVKNLQFLNQLTFMTNPELNR